MQRERDSGQEFFSACAAADCSCPVMLAVYWQPLASPRPRPLCPRRRLTCNKGGDSVDSLFKYNSALALFKDEWIEVVETVPPTLHPCCRDYTAYRVLEYFLNMHGKNYRCDRAVATECFQERNLNNSVYPSVLTLQRGQMSLVYSAIKELNSLKIHTGTEVDPKTRLSPHL